MESILQTLYDSVEQANTKYNDHVDEFNNLFDELEKTKVKLTEIEAREVEDWKVMQKQETVIQAAVLAAQKDRADINALRAQNKEYQRLDPKRLAKQNKGYKKSIDDLKERLANSEKARKQAIKHAKDIQQGAKTEGNAAFHFNPTTKNAIRIVPTLHVSKTNAFNGVVGSPVIEFIHHTTGITRQGTLLNDGTVAWASASNSMPSKDESRIAREYLFDWCKRKGIKCQEAA